MNQQDLGKLLVLILDFAKEKEPPRTVEDRLFKEAIGTVIRRIIDDLE